MRPMRRRTDMPSDETVLLTQLWTIAHLVRQHRGLVEVELAAADNADEPEHYEVYEVVDLTDELHPKVILKVRPILGQIPAQD